MALSAGKIFERNFEKSAPDYAKVYRIPDQPQSFNRTANLRFSRKNPFDYLIWDSKRRRLFALELKTVAGKSIAFEREEEHKTDGIHYHQILGLNDWNAYNGITCGFLIEFREMELTIFVDIEAFNRIMECVNKKSFNLKDLDDYDIPYLIIPQRKLKANYRYDIDKLLSDAEN